MNEDLKLLLDKADTLKGELSALRPLPEDALQKTPTKVTGSKAIPLHYRKPH